jgi:hypothetical protein
LSWDTRWWLAAICALFLVLGFNLVWKDPRSSIQRERLFRLATIYIELSIFVAWRFVPTYFSPRATVTGRVVESVAAEGRKRDRSYLNVESSPTEFTRIETKGSVVRRISPNEGVRITYLVWSSDPLTIEILWGENAGFVLNEPAGHRVSVFTGLLILAAYIGFGIYVLRFSKSSSDPPAFDGA